MFPGKPATLRSKSVHVHLAPGCPPGNSSTPRCHLTEKPGPQAVGLPCADAWARLT